ncbi:cysteine--tRNA ligase [Kallotenue papyrolyticum]|uniref:cysteine--tRNA ligase n=1 Tax=Kallotenue papyrolyticum TaxID=1325125 RepID=UPI000478665F|nr:cysteine--tRNA ligase [Kallotenue papyrolyticum]
MTLQIYNTLTARIEPFETLEPNRVKMYVCGPTVYDKAHIGHAMSALVFDIIRRYLEYRGYQVRHVQNFTDVDDKIINRARDEGRDPFELAEDYIQEWHRHVRDLNILPASAYPRATETIPEIIRLIETLIERGHAYAANGDVYFRVRTDPDYGKLSHRSLDDMRAGARIAPDERKDDPLDFALWKAAKPGEPAWESPWGPGRPGWHIECSAMTLKELGPQIDIHGGGNDLIFPHHENEIAQSESATGLPFARYWVHNGMLQIRSATGELEKMSKSLGNLVTIDDFLAEHPADVLRLIVLGSPYRAPLVYDATVVAENERKLERLINALRPATGSTTSGPAVTALERGIDQAQQAFEAAMDDDFNGPGATAALFEMVRAINIARDAGVGGAPFAAAQERFRALAGVLGLRLELPTRGATEAAPFVDLLVRTRSELRKARQFALADQIRNELAELGVLLEDTPHGTTWRWK